MTSRWISVTIVLLFVGLVAQRIWRYATFEAVRPNHEMPRQVVDREESDLYLTPGGAYTQADITANGPTLPSQKYRDFLATHDFQPRPGDRLCPVTRTKANAECTWIIGGHMYEFCCPPCIAEFVRRSKDRPNDIQPPGNYIKLP